MKQKLSVMLGIQERLNQKLNPDWRNAGYNWRDAIMIEATELYDHLPWKWWKSYTKDIDWGQANLEAVDIWHFILSEVLQYESEELIDTVLRRLTLSSDTSATASVPTIQYWVKDLLCATMTPTFTGIPVKACVDMYGDAATMVDSFKSLIDALGLNFDTLYKLYVGKAKLNEFRWANGYGSTYIKDWFGQEDNQYLTQLSETLDVNDPAFSDNILKGLSSRYEEVKDVRRKIKETEVEEYKVRIEEML